MVFISRKDIYGKLKEKKLVESRVEFDSTCRKGNWQSKKGKVAAEAIFEAFDLDHDKKGNLLNKVLKFLNSKPEKADGLEIGAAKRPRINMDMSIDEDDLDVSMYEEPEEIPVNKLQEKIKELEGKLAVTTGFSGSLITISQTGNATSDRKSDFRFEFLGSNLP
ncbi:Hypothetical protein FKW44_001365 [Caligus rogercresseyi]|uniref:Uncharacterized protein n=1 Tax=Caligus rogercresseyi TaxID=217165 RepID=A0A7T8KIP3_CALRO|nr:Hypothetical protein FKW44_001365 [Caligus rogercresseyi]